MKRTLIILSLIFALAIALSASIPTLASNTDTGTTIITGTIKGSIDITANTPTATITGMDPEVMKESTTPVSVTVKSNKAGWKLTVKEDSGGDGYMSNGSVILANPLMVKGGDLGTTLTSIVGGPELENNGAKGTAEIISPIIFAQNASWADDAALTYSITVVFTATVTE